MTMEQHINTDAFTAITSSTLEVELPAAKTKLKVRRMPGTTTLRLLAEIARCIETETSVYVTQLREAIALAMKKAPDVEEGAPPATGSQRGWDMFLKVLPALSGLLRNTPEMVKSVMLDVVPGITPEVLNAMALEDMLEILNSVFIAMDKAVLGRQVDTIFFGITGVADAATSVMEDVTNPQQ